MESIAFRNPTQRPEATNYYLVLQSKGQVKKADQRN